MKALGMVEVRGYLGAVSAADAALKAADVRLNSTECITGGLTTIMLVGDVAAVEAAVEAAVQIATQLGCLRGHHVIARVDAMTADMIGGRVKQFTSTTTNETSIKTLVTSSMALSSNVAIEDVSDSENQETLSLEVATTLDQGEIVSEGITDNEYDKEKLSYEDSLSQINQESIESPMRADESLRIAVSMDSLLQDLQNMRVVELRRLAYRIRVKGLKRTAIKFANKETLIRVIMEEAERGEVIDING